MFTGVALSQLNLRVALVCILRLTAAAGFIFFGQSLISSLFSPSRHLLRGAI